MVARVGKFYPQKMEKRKREQGKSQAWPSAWSSHKLTDVQKEVLEPKGGILFCQEAWPRRSVRAGQGDLAVMPYVSR